MFVCFAMIVVVVMVAVLLSGLVLPGCLGCLTAIVLVLMVAGCFVLLWLLC